MSHAELAQRVFSAAHLGQFKLRSGTVSSEYFDKYQFESDHPPERHLSGHGALIPPETDYLAGLEMGGIAIATVLSQLSGVPAYSFARAPSNTVPLSLLKGLTILASSC